MNFFIIKAQKQDNGTWMNLENYTKKIYEKIKKERMKERPF
jgi:hypothetical protein